jgi:hypothetical protein
MFYVLQNESTAARRRVPILLTDAATGTTAQSGVALTNIYSYVNINGGAFIGGTGSLGEAGFGQYYYEFEANEVATLGLAGIHITAAGCRDYDAISQVAAFDVYSASAGGGISAYDVWQFDASTFSNLSEAGGLLNAAYGSASSADSNANLAVTQTANIAFSVWGEDIGTGLLSPFAAGTAGTILYTLGQGGTALTAGDVWDYATRTITGGIADTVTLVTSPVDISYPSMAGLANTIWSTDVSGYVSPSAGFDLTQAASGGAGLTAGDVWDFVITGFGGTGSAAVALSGAYSESANTYNQLVNFTPSDIWSYAGIEGRTITGGIADTVTTLTNRSGFAITGGTVDTVTNAVDVSTASMAGIANTVWSTLTAPYTTHATFGHQILRSDNAATIGEVTLHQSGGSKRVDADVHAFVNNTASATAMLNILTGIGASMTTNITGNLSGSVGSVTNPVDVSTSSMSGIANTVWATDVSGYASPSAGFDLSNVAGGGITAGDVWSYATRTITGGIADTVTTVSGNVLGSVNSVVTDVTISTGTQASIANSVWSADVSGYTSPSAGFDLSNASSGAGLTAGDVSVAVWDSPVASYTTNGTFGLNILRSDNAGVAGTVSLWTGGAFSGVYADTYRIDADYGAATALRDVLTGIGSSITANITGNLIGSVDSVTNDVNVSTASMTGIAGTVWSTDVSGYTSPSAGFDLSNASSGAGLTAGDVWTYATREITGGIADTVTTLTNRSGFAITGGTVDTVTNGVTVSTNNDKTGYSLSGSQSFNLTGNITGNLSGSVGSVSGNVGGSVNSVLSDVPVNEALISADVWTYATRTLTSGAGISAGDVWSYATRTVTGGVIDNATVSTIGSTALAGIATTVWRYNINQDKPVANSGETAWYLENVGPNVWGNEMSGYTIPGNQAGYKLNLAASGVTSNSPANVWSYASRTITGGIADTVTTLTNKSGFAITGGTVDTVTNPVTFDSAQYAGIASSVWNAATRTLTSTGAGISAYDVWNFDPTAMTSPQAGAILTDIQTDTNTIITDIGNVPNNVWASDVSGYSTPGEAGFELSQAAAGAGLTAGDVWTYASRTITGGIADTVTTLTDRAGFAITGGTVDTVTNGVTVSTNNDKTGYSLSGTQSFNLTGNITGNLSGSVDSVTNPVTFDSVQYAGIASSVWNAATRTLTSSGSGISAFDVWNFVLSDANTAEVDLVQAAAGSGLTSGDVWSYASRTITGGIADTVTTLTNRSGFAITGGTVDNVTNGVTVSTNNDKTGYSLSGSQSFNLTGNITGNLSGSVGSVTSGVTVTTNNDKTGYALSGAGVSAVQSGLSTLTQAQVGTEVDASLVDVGLTTTVTGRIDATVSSRLASASYTAPPTEAAIWSYSPRTLTSGAGASAYEVWNFATRSLTSGAGITVNAATNIINGPYFVKSNVDSQDGNLDVIRGMVQDIQLTVTDAFQNPFDVTALGLAVNFYDQAGSLVTSYGTSNLYAPAGLVQFTLDTAVTANEGRYNLILSAAGSGNTIKFGPLQTLVRPF